MDNFVDIVGYQFERVHTGVISWILDTKNISVSMDTKYEVLRGIYRICHRTIDFLPTEVQCITCIPEYSFGRRRKIDLVVKVDLYSRTPKYLVLEMKVDSIPTSDQLLGTHTDFVQKNNCEPDDAVFLLLLFGSSEACSLPALHGFVVFGLLYIIEVFAGLHIDEYVYKSWIESLGNEEVRRTSIKTAITDAPQIWDSAYWLNKGYRPWFSLFYYMYAELQGYSKRRGEWDIYSGNNNPVMNWKYGWIDKNIMGCPVQFYWEFNYEEFVLKVLLDSNHKLPPNDLMWLRDEIAAICVRDTPHNGRRAQNRYGTFASLFRWAFDFKNQTFTEIMSGVDNILDVIHPKLFFSVRRALGVAIGNEKITDISKRRICC